MSAEELLMRNSELSLLLGMAMAIIDTQIKIINQLDRHGIELPTDKAYKIFNQRINELFYPEK